MESFQVLMERLPITILDDIVVRVLDDPPFVTLNSLGQVCRMWRKILFCNSYLIFVHGGYLRIFHCTKKSRWETISLQFCQDQVPGLQLASLELVFSEGGVLCLSTGVDGEFVFCNPLTRRCSDTVRRDAGRPIISGVGGCDPVITTWCISAWWPRRKPSDLKEKKPPREYSSRLLRAKVFYSDSLRKFRVMLRYNVSHDRRKTLRIIVLDFRSGRWCQNRSLDGGKMENDFKFFLRGRGLARFPGSEGVDFMQLGFRDAGGDFRHMYVYDVSDGKCWRQKTVLTGLERTLLGRIIDDSEFVVDGELRFQPQAVSTSFMRSFPYEVASTKSIAAIRPEKELNMKLIQFTEGGVECWVSILRRSLGMPGRVDYMAVRMFYRDSDQDDCSDWTEWAPGVAGKRIVENFHVLRPQFVFSFADRQQLYDWTSLWCPD